MIALPLARNGGLRLPLNPSDTLEKRNDNPSAGFMRLAKSPENLHKSAAEF